MKRREFISLIGGAAVAASGPARAQADRVRHIGVLMGYAQSDADTQARMAAFREAFEQLGWKDGRNVAITYRFGVAELDRVRDYAKELVDSNPDLIVCETTPALKAVADHTGTIPIVFVSVTDPVSNGFVTDLAHPGGNITGFTNFETTMGGKWIELLKKIAPSSRRVGVIFNPDTAPYAGSFNSAIQAAAAILGMSITRAPVRDDAGTEKAITAAAREPGGGLIILPDIFTSSHRDTIVAAAARYALPVIGIDAVPRRGGLMSHWYDSVEMSAQAASYINRILKGASPADLPVQQPTKFLLIINLKTARALGLTVPQTILERADEVIE